VVGEGVTRGDGKASLTLLLPFSHTKTYRVICDGLRANAWSSYLSRTVGSSRGICSDSLSCCSNTIQQLMGTLSCLEERKEEK
jgi:hypothetical protein